MNDYKIYEIQKNYETWQRNHNQKQTQILDADT